MPSNGKSSLKGIALLRMDFATTCQTMVDALLRRHVADFDGVLGKIIVALQNSFPCPANQTTVAAAAKMAKLSQMENDAKSMPRITIALARSPRLQVPHPQQQCAKARRVGSPLGLAPHSCNDKW